MTSFLKSAALIAAVLNVAGCSNELYISGHAKQESATGGTLTIKTTTILRHLDGTDGSLETFLVPYSIPPGADATYQARANQLLADFGKKYPDSGYSQLVTKVWPLSRAGEPSPVSAPIPSPEPAVIPEIETVIADQVTIVAPPIALPPAP
jgi:hypothetical protein